MDVELVQCKRTDPRYAIIRNRHYVENHGCIGQQLHYLIFVDGAIAGIISAGSSAYSVKCRDDFFGITKETRKEYLPCIVDNVVFRLELHVKNLATMVMAMWRRRVAEDWKRKYHVEVMGFETFVVETDTRKGALYKADNWTLVGETSGSTKTHKHGVGNKSERLSVCKKLVYCKWVGKPPTTSYKSTWREAGVESKLLSSYESRKLIEEDK